MSDVPQASQAHFRSLSVTLTKTFLTFSLLVLGIATIFQIVFSYQAQTVAVKTQQQLAAQSAADIVKGFVEDKLNALDQAVAVNNVVGSPERGEFVMYKLIGRNAAFRQLVIYDPAGSRVRSVSRLSNTSDDALAREKSKLLAVTSRGDFYISDVYIDDRTSEPLVLIAVPTRDELRDPRGALVAEVNLKFMWDLVGSIQVGENGLAYVVDRSGHLIAARDISRVLAREDVSAVHEVSQFISGIEEGSHATPDTGLQGSYVVTGHVALGSPAWAVVVETPFFEAYASVIRQLVYSLIILAMSGFLAAWSGRYFSRRITHGIVSLDAVANKISEGTLDVAIEVDPEDKDNEVGHLAASFSSMTKTLRDLYKHMDAKIKEKTTELSSQVAEVQRSKTAILNLLEDINEEKGKAEGMVVERTKELNDEKARLLASIESLSLGFIIADINDRVVIKNSALTKILELSSDPVYVRDIADSLRGVSSQIDVLIHSCRECVEMKHAVELKEVSHGKKYLRVFCAPISTKAAETEDPSIIGYAILIEDITEAKVMERSRDEFFAVASHELRTPLTAIRGNVDMILSAYGDKIVDNDVKEMLADINASSIRLIGVVNDFLEVSRLEQGRIELKKEIFSIGDVIDKATRDMKPLIDQKGLSFAYVEPQGSLPLVYADKNKTEQILLNLLGNAAKFTQQGSITLSVVVDKGFVAVRVTDTGVGISEHNQARLFRKFQQAGEDMLARDVTQSTGLGLYISKLIISSMGGTIGLEKSELGKGSTFFFSLPISSQAQPVV